MKHLFTQRVAALSASIIFLMLLGTTSSLAQCYMACNNNVPISLDENCEATVEPDDIIEGFETTPCNGPFTIEILDENDNIIPTNPVVTGTYLGMTLTVRAIDGASTNYCWGTITVLDGLAPVLTNCGPLSLPCSVDPQPVSGQLLMQTQRFSASPNAVIGPGINTLQFAINVNLPDNAYVNDVNVSLQIDHPASNQLDVFLSNPSTTNVELGTDLCGNFPNWNVTFDDEAGSTAAAACNPGNNPTLAGSVQPEGLLSDFDNQPAQGPWLLRISDDTNGLGGSLQFVNLTITYTVLAAYEPSASDNCTTATLNFTDAITPGTCNDPFTQIINRTWTATDQSGNSSQCTQTITFNRLPVSAVVIPPNYDDISRPALLCKEKETDPAGAIIPNIGWNALPNGYPSPYDEYYPAPFDDIVKWYGTGVPSQSCGMVQSTFGDQRIEICPGLGSDACFKIVRTWIITDWCTGDIRTETQIIKVADKEAPMIDGISDLTIGTDFGSCESTWLATLPSLSDNCNPAVSLTYSVSSSSGTVSPAPNNRFRITGLSVGMHVITYIASDCCGNQTTQTMKLTVEDNEPPTAVCDEHTQVQLTIDGTTKVFASTFDDLSHDNCGAVYFKVIRMDEFDSNSNGITPETVQMGDWQSSTCNGINGDDDPRVFPPWYQGSQSYFDDYVKFCCEDTDADFVQVVFRVFDVDPGTGSILPERMMPGGDLHGRFNDCMVEVIVQDKVPPIISCPPDLTLLCFENYLDTTLTGSPIAFDNCELDTVYFEDSDNLNSCNVGKVNRRWIATDAGGRSSSCIQMITLIDTTAPILFFPPDTIVGCGESMEPSNTGTATGFDDCAQLLVNYDDLLFEFPDSCTRKILRTWTILDWCTRETWTDLQVIKEFDEQAPTFVGVPNDTLVPCESVPPPPTIGMDLTADDNCDRDVEIDFMENRIDGNCPYNYTLERIWTAEDNCGNIAVDTQIVIVVDTMAPIIVGVPADMTLECDQFPAAGANPTASDNCDPMPRLMMTEVTTPGSCTDNFTVVRTWTASDTCGNVSTATQTIVFEDTTPPVITGVPTDMTLECDETLPPNATPTATDNCDPDPVITFTQTRTDGSCEDNYIINRTYMATDRCGNTSTVTQQITFQDTTDPVLSGVPADVSVECDNVPAVAMPTAVDNCDPDPDIVPNEVRMDGICLDNYILIRTWTATDRCGNSTAQSQMITVSDNTPPTIDNAPADITLACDAPLPSIPMLGATDNCDPNPSVDPFEDVIPGGCSDESQIIRTWTATDRCGNLATATQIITIIDTVAPVLMNIPPDITAECTDDSTPTVTATDNCDTMVLVTVMEMSGGACDGNNTRVLVWAATDNCGNSSTASQVITLEDTTPPELVGVPADVTVECDNIPPRMDPMATDTCSGAMLSFDERREDGSCTDEFQIIRIWTATDGCGNMTVDSQLISVIDTTPPILMGIPDDLMLICDMVPDPPMIGTDITAMDNCDTMVVITLMADTMPGSCINEFTITRFWTAMDNCGNTTVDSQIINLLDTIPPVIIGVPNDTTVLCDSIPAAPMIGSEITATDNCNPMVDITLAADTMPGRCENEFTIRRIWEAIDDCDNVSRDTQLISVIDTIGPILTGVPNDTIVICSMVPDPAIIGVDITATDNCDGMVMITAAADTIPGRCENEFTIRRIWIATDDCDNVSRDTQFVSLLDTLAPIITMIPNDTTVLCDQPLPPFDPMMAIATDDCDNAITFTTRADTIPGRCENEFTILRIWTAADDCDNISRDTQMISVIDTIPPIINGVPDDITVLCDAVPAPPTIGVVITATDNCTGLVNIVPSADTLPGNCPNEFTIRRIWTATDVCDNMSRDTQLVNVIDTIPPVINGVPADITVLCDALPAIPAPGSVTAIDNCDSDPELSVEQDTIPGQCTHEFTLLRIWVATDTCDNVSRDTQMISVLDTIPPMLAGIPGDTTVLCSELPANPVIGMEVTAADNCDTLVMISLATDSIPGNCTNEYTLVRVWTAVDDCGNMSRDTQNLMVIDTVAPILMGIPVDTLIDCRDTLIPPMITATDNCDTSVIVTLNEQTVDSCAGGLIRTWTATDACGNSSMATQVISVIDTTPPMLTVPGPIQFLLEQGDSCDQFFSIIATATDNCDDNVTITHDSPFAFDPGNMHGDASGDYPIIDTIIVFTATDDCGNSTTGTTRIQVGDGFGPTFTCESLSVTLDANTGIFIIEPEDIVVFAEDLCSPPVTLAFDPMSSPNPNFDTLTCLDRPADFVFVQITDAAGITNICGALVNVLQPNPMFCDTMMAPPGMIVAGRLTTEKGEYIEDADIMISGGMNTQAINDPYGYFHFSGLPSGYNYTITPEKNDDPLNGVSTYDLVLMSRHILGLEPITSPYKLIAADVNNSGTITTFDIVELRKLILFINTEFPDNQSWRFVEEAYDFPLSSDPFANTWPEVYNINDLSSNLLDVNFMGIKIGDINGSVKAHQFAGAEDRSTASLPIVVQDQLLKASESVEVEFKAKDFKQMEGFQLSLAFDQHLLEFEGVGSTNSLTGLSQESFGQALISKGLLTMSWFDHEAHSLEDEEVLFSLHFRAKTTAPLRQAIRLADTYTEAEAYRTGIAPMPLALHIEPSVETPIVQADFQLFQNRPNPFTDETIVPFYLPSGEHIIFSVFDVSGKLVLQKQDRYSAGYQEISINSSELPDNQIFYYQLKTDHHMATKKMILQGR